MARGTLGVEEGLLPGSLNLRMSPIAAMMPVATVRLASQDGLPRVRSGAFRHAAPGRVSKLAEALHEEMLRRSGRRKRIVEERVDLDAERLDHVGSAPADDVERLGGGRESIGPFVLRVVLGGP